MRKFIKVNIFLIILMFISCCLTKAQAIAKTGHKEFNEINFLYNQNAKLIINLSTSERNEILKKVKRKAFGWSNYSNIINATVSYTANSIFSRSNNTNQTIKFSYSTSITRKEQLTKTLSGTLSLKASGKIDSISLSLDQSIRSEIGYKSEITFEEETDFDVKIDPGRKISLIIKGYANLSSGASKYYFFGICTDKKIWEYVDVVNEYYELYEEKL